jgi:paraquat-inducible protein A
MSALVTASGEDAPRPLLVCRACAQRHHEVLLRAGERAKCARCGTLMTKRGWFRRDAALAFAVTGLLLAIPAATLPFVTVDKLRNERVGFLFTGPEALWQEGMPVLSVWVTLCGIIAPMLLLSALFFTLLPRATARDRTTTTLYSRIAHALEHWAMPEVYVLAVLVALTKLGTLVNVSVGPGMWCYCGMAAMTLLAWRSFEYEPADPTGTASAPRP